MIFIVFSFNTASRFITFPISFITSLMHTEWHNKIRDIFSVYCCFYFSFNIQHSNSSWLDAAGARLKESYFYGSEWKNLSRIHKLFRTPSWEIANLIRIKEGRVPWPVVGPGGIYGDSAVGESFPLTSGNNINPISFRGQVLPTAQACPHLIWKCPAGPGCARASQKTFLYFFIAIKAKRRQWFILIIFHMSSIFL